MTLLKNLLAPCLALLLAGCTGLGSKPVRSGRRHSNYNRTARSCAKRWNGWPDRRSP